MDRGAAEFKNGNHDRPHFEVRFRKVGLLLTCGMEDTWEGGDGSEENPTSWLLHQTGQLGKEQEKEKTSARIFI